MKNFPIFIDNNNNIISSDEIQLPIRQHNSMTLSSLAVQPLRCGGKPSSPRSSESRLAASAGKDFGRGSLEAGINRVGVL